MGLFDYVRCEVPLPDGFAGELQTKDFDDPYMETYTIRADGRLIHDKPRYDIDPPGTHHGLIDTNFHGVLNFYGSEGTAGGEDWKWHEYNAKFTDGDLVEIVQIRGFCEVFSEAIKRYTAASLSVEKGE
jgi:hypothetical protein